jgi:hypothetical protein
MGDITSADRVGDVGVGGQHASNQARLRAAAMCVRPGLEGNRSDKLLRLFDFLLERSIEGKPPTEHQIADEVFSEGRTYAPPGDANVRVYVYRLRKLLRELPESPGGDRLDLPTGSYVLRLVGEGDSDVNVDAAPVQPGRRAPFTRVAPGRLLILLGLAAVVGVVAWLLLRPAADVRLSDAMPWNAIGGSDRPIVLVLGDYYFYESRPDSPGSGPPKLVWERSVTTPEDLIIHQMLNPDTASRVVDTDQHYVTSGTIAAAFAIRAALRRDAIFRQRELLLITASQLTPELLKTNDVIYLGQLSGVSPILHDPLVQASPLRLNDDLISVTDGSTGKQYRSDGVELRDLQISRRDYGYISRIPGPMGNTLIVIAGLRDPGLKEMAELAIDPARLAQIPPAIARSAQGFEALYHVRTMGSVNLMATTVLQRSIRTQGIWDRSAGTPEYHPIPAPSETQR